MGANHNLKMTIPEGSHTVTPTSNRTLNGKFAFSRFTEEIEDQRGEVISPAASQ